MKKTLAGWRPCVGRDALTRLYAYALHGQPPNLGSESEQIVARFLIGLLTSHTAGFDVSDLMLLDAKRHADCLAVLRWLRDTHTPLRRHVAMPERFIAQLASVVPRLHLRPDISATARYVGTQSTPGLRNLVVQLAAMSEDGNSAPVTVDLHLSAQDSAALCEALVEAHYEAWQRERGPIDGRPGEARPDWLTIS